MVSAYDEIAVMPFVCGSCGHLDNMLEIMPQGPETCPATENLIMFDPMPLSSRLAGSGGDDGAPTPFGDRQMRG